MVSIYTPLNINALNSALTQSGGGTTEHEVQQEQSSTQNNQVITGDGSVLSGNNLQCQNQDNSEVGLGLCPDFPGTIASGTGDVPLQRQFLELIT